MAQKSGKYTINGTVLLSTILQTIGYKGTNALSFCSIKNLNATPLYIVLDNQNTVPPATPSDGLSIGNAEETKSFLFNSFNGEDFLDAGTTWLNAGSAIDIKVSAIGGGA